MVWKPENAPPRKRCKRYNTPGQSHFLTFSCFGRQAFLSRERTCQWLADAVIRAREKYAFKLIAYVFMPEHVHLLIHPTQREYDISAILESIKIPVGRKARNFVVKHAPEFIERMRVDSGVGPMRLQFWQAGGGHDRNIYSAEEMWEKIHYTHRNPVKRKLTARGVEWKWSSAADYAKVRVGPLPVDNRDLPWLPQ